MVEFPIRMKKRVFLTNVAQKHIKSVAHLILRRNLHKKEPKRKKCKAKAFSWSGQQSIRYTVL